MTNTVVLTLVLSIAQSGLNSVNSFVREAGHLNVRSDLNWLWGETALDVGQEVILDLRCDVHVGENIGVLFSLGAVERQL